MLNWQSVYLVSKYDRMSKISAAGFFAAQRAKSPHFNRKRGCWPTILNPTDALFHDSP
jgi:hypothetical protein